MIEVANEPEVDLRTGREIQSVLSLHIGRILRVSSIEEDEQDYYDYYEDFTPPPSSYSLEESIGSLARLNLSYGLNEANGSEGWVQLSFSGSADPLRIAPERTAIEVLQEDSGLWKTLHRGSGWINLNRKTEEL